MTSGSPRISIVLPTYNGSAYLAESLRSCLDQTRGDFELIVVDDASVDATAPIVAEFATRDPRIRSIRHPINRGLPAALNTGFAASRGAYLTWTSDDNRYTPTALAEMGRALDADPQVAYVYADIEIIDEEGCVIAQERAMEPLELLTGHQGTGLACFLYRRGVYERIGAYAEDLVLAEDYDYWLRMLVARVGMRHLHTPLYQYRRHAQSLTDARRGGAFLAAERALLRRLPEMPWLDHSLRGQAYLYLASLATWRGDSRAALGYTMRALRHAPGHTAAKLGSFVLRRANRASRASPRTPPQTPHAGPSVEQGV
jgi:glycosyltransferase involved in cell wall biosynthesis